MRTLRTNRETIPEGFHDEVLSDHITHNREASQQINDPQSLPVHEVARVRPELGGDAIVVSLEHVGMVSLLTTSPRPRPHEGSRARAFLASRRTRACR